MKPNIVLRPALPSDADAVSEVYLASRKAFLPFAPLVHSDVEVRAWIAAVVLPGGGVTVAVCENVLVGMMATRREDGVGWIEHFYIAPGWTGVGLGELLLAHAKSALGPPIRLYTFQANTGARRFYKRHGFRATAFGDGQDNEEKCPDVLYEWTGAPGQPQRRGTVTDDRAKKRMRSHQTANSIAVAIFVIVASVFVHGFLVWSARVRHIQSGVSLGELRNDLLQYADDHNDTLPPMRGQMQFHTALWPYTRSEGVFHAYDDAHRLFLPNPNLSGRKLRDVRHLTVVLYESDPARSDGSRWVAFLPEKAIPPLSFGASYASDPDFRGLALVKESAWQRLKASNDIP